MLHGGLAHPQVLTPESAPSPSAEELLGTTCISVRIAYLQSRTLVWEGRTEERGDDAHDNLGDILLQNGVCVLPVTCVVTGLEDKSML